MINIITCKDKLKTKIHLYLNCASHCNKISSECYLTFMKENM